MKIKINDITTDYEFGGKPEALVVALVHGFPFAKAMWNAQAGPLRKDYRVLSYDLRGMGESELGEAPQLLEHYVDDLLALLDHVGAAKAAVCGLSMGGYIALRLAQKAPERLWALVLADTRPDADGDEAKLKRAAGISALRKNGTAPFAEGMLPNLLSAATLSGKPDLAKGLLRIMQANAPAGLANALAAMAARTDTTPALAGLKVPALVMVGEADKITPPETAKAMSAKIPGAELVQIASAAHVSNWENPEAFNAALLTFLKKVPLGAAGA